jgi:hypothetical protein
MAPHLPFTRLNALDKQPLHSGTTTPVNGTINHIPDQPNVALDDGDILRFLEKELNTKVLDQMYDWLWLCAAMDSKRIDPLHAQLVKGRVIISSEDMALHLVWHEDKMFIKPIPPALLNYDFWINYLRGEKTQFDREIALGFLRSYGLLIRHRTDLNIALDKGLVPKHVDWLQWELFIESFRNLEDREVAKRYHFGSLRLTRLNVLIRILRPRKGSDAGNNRHYQPMYWYTTSYMRQFSAPLLFIFASVSLMLSAMQVVLTLPIEPANRSWVRNLQYMSNAFWGFCVFVLVVLAFSWLLLLGCPILYAIAQQIFGYEQRKRFRAKNRIN